MALKLLNTGHTGATRLVTSVRRFSDRLVRNHAPASYRVWSHNDIGLDWIRLPCLVICFAMNRYRGYSGPSKASPTTQCQKCLQKDMYSPSLLGAIGLTSSTALQLRVHGNSSRQALHPSTFSDSATIEPEIDSCSHQRQT